MLLIKYLRPDGTAFISTPNKGLFSLSKEKSFVNPTHVKELFFDEFTQLVSENFSVCEFYSVVHKSHWHSAYINYLCARNLVYALRYEILGNGFIAKIISRIGKYLLYMLIFVMKSKNYANVRSRKYTDFEFIEGYDNHAIWFVAICSNSI